MPRVDRATYRYVIRRLPRGYPHVYSLATLAGLMVNHGRNVTLLSDAMGRSRGWTYKRLAELEEAFEDLLELQSGGTGMHISERD